MKAQGFYNHGEWKAMCPEYGCNDAVAVYPQSKYPPFARSTTPVLQQVCARGHSLEIEWPAEQLRAQLEAVLSQRALDEDRSWYPAGHEWAILHGFPTGQTIRELTDESQHVARARADERTANEGRVREALSALGIAVRPDGTFEGRI